MRRVRFLFTAIALLAVHRIPFAVGGESFPFDGLWNVTLTCPAYHEEEDAKGYVHRFAAQVKAGEFRGTHATEGQPGWHLLSGSIEQDGSANLKLEGIVNDPGYAVGKAYRGKAYTYRVRAKFGPSSGIGQRIGKRKCEFQFERQSNSERGA